MKIGQISRETGVSVRMLRYYEAEGLLAPHRTATGYRDYTHDDVQTVTRIKLLGAGGMTLGTIRQFLPCVRGDRPIFEPCDELRILLHRLIGSTDQKIGKLHQSKAVLESFLADIEDQTA